MELSFIISCIRRFVKYKHRYSIDISSQETFEENILGSNYNVQQETTNPNVASQEETELVDAELQESELVGEWKLLMNSFTEKRLIYSPETAVQSLFHSFSRHASPISPSI